MGDMIERLRAANPVPSCPPPPIEAVWRRLEFGEGPDAPRDADLSAGGRLIARGPSLGGVISAVAAMTAIAIAVAAIALLGRGGTGARTSPQADGSSVLASIHAQADRLLGPRPGLAARVESLHGLPIVINVWASWCEPCRAEFAQFASASARYGHQVAFLGVDSHDTTTDARAFLARHAVGYPSYQTTDRQLKSILSVGLSALPTTIFINPAGKVAYVHLGEYLSLAGLEHDVAIHLQRPQAPASPTSSAQALITELGVLRQPQTPQARAFASRLTKRLPAEAPARELSPDLTRLVDLPAGGTLFLYVAPLTPSTPNAYGLGYHEVYPGSEGGGCCQTAEALRTPRGPGPDQFSSAPNPHTMYFEIVPDGVTRVRWVFPRHPIEPSGVPGRKPLGVDVSVHDNVAAVELPQRGAAAQDTWYAADGHVIARYTATGREPRPKSLRHVLRAIA